MKNFKFYAAFAAAAVTFGLSSCSYDEYKYDPENAAKYEALKAQYNLAFAQQFGEIPANHDWGFGKVAPIQQKAETRATDPNSNQWADKYIIPAVVGEAEAQYVFDVFNSYDATKGGVTLNFTDYFVQQVWQGQSIYKDGYGQDVKGSSEMNHLIAGNDHVYNFNASNNLDNEGRQRIVNGSTNIFGYHNSRDSKDHYEYIALAIDVPGVGMGYYVGFDFKADGVEPNQKVDKDGVYTDWIVKIVPGMFKNAMRVMCEDLGTTDDFDFNDVVFDVAYEEVWWPEHVNSAIITLQSAGGTMPLYIAGKEVHEAFGVSEGTMVNTGVGSACPVVQWRVNVQSTDPKDIEVKVNNTKDAIEYVLEAEQGKAPFKICVPVTVQWSPERQNIKETYPKFAEWVANPNNHFWE